MRAAALRVGVALSLLAAARASLEPTRTQQAAPALDKRHNNFVAIKDGKFTLGGKPFFHLSTTAYWLAQLSDADITTTLKTISDTGFKVVRTWAFNDVTEIPPNNGTFFQLLANGTATINEGPTGLQRLDKVVTEAEKLGLKLHLTLTNNWSALKDLESASLTFPNGFLSNNYGGMDAYVRNFISPDAEHDHFFTNDSLITIFENYVTTVVKRYASSPAVFAWEIANDPRCVSTQPTTPGCVPQNITRWVDRVSRTVKAADPFHLVASGAGGFMCVDCPKLFATPRPAPSPSAAAGQKKRGTGALLSPARVLAKRTALLKKWRKSSPGAAKRTIRGRWAAPETRRQLTPGAQGTAFNGAQGVDSEDINAIQNIDFSTFQLFPDQNQYMGVDAPDVDPVTQAIDSGIAWIQTNGDAARAAGKPSALTAFGLVSQNSSQHFVPFNHSSVTVADVLSNVVKIIGANDTQQADAYRRWIQAAMESGVGGIGQYQHGQTFGDSSTSSLVTDSPLTDIDGVANSTQTSPDDGYAAFSDTLNTVFQQAAQQQTALNGVGG